MQLSQDLLLYIGQNYLKNSKCKILFTINKNSITEHIYKDYINDTLQKNKNSLTITNF